MKATRRLVVALGACAIVLSVSCGDGSPTGVGNQPATPAPDALLGGLLQPTGLLNCTPLPYDSVTRTIGPAGGTINVGPHSLWIAPGSLSGPVTITAVAPTGTQRAVRFRPEGLNFNGPAYLTMSYAQCSLLGTLLPKRIAYTTDLFQILEYLLSLDNILSKKVTGRIRHFSHYAVAW
jgi:hypothetical protein